MDGPRVENNKVKHAPDKFEVIDVSRIHARRVDLKRHDIIDVCRALEEAA